MSNETRSLTQKFSSLQKFERVRHSFHLDAFRPPRVPKRSTPKISPRWFFGGDEQTLEQTYSPKEVQVAFKVLMTHWILQFAWRIAFRCVLHRCGSQDIRCWKCLITLLQLFRAFWSASKYESFVINLTSLFLPPRRVKSLGQKVFKTPTVGALGGKYYLTTLG